MNKPDSHSGGAGRVCRAYLCWVARECFSDEVTLTGRPESQKEAARRSPGAVRLGEQVSFGRLW